MKRNLIFSFFIGIVAIILILKFSVALFVEPWIGEKAEAAFREKSKDYLLKIGKINFSLFQSTLEMKKIAVRSKSEQNGLPDLTGEIASIRLKGIKLMKFLLKKDIIIREVTISGCWIKGKLIFPEKNSFKIVSPRNMSINSLLIDKTEIEIENATDAKAYSLKEGMLKLYNIRVGKQDTLSAGLIRQFEFNARDFISVSSDSLYTYRASGICCSTSSNSLAADSISIHPNYRDYDFSARHKFQSDRIEAGFIGINIHDFSADEYLKSGNFFGSYIEISKLDMDVFRDKRKKFRHIKKTDFQEMIYNYPGKIDIDSIGILTGKVRYREHAEKANEPGYMSFDKINAKIYKVTNDTIYKSEKGFLTLNAQALLMGKGKLKILLKGRLFDKYNTFTLNGTLSEMDVKFLNPMLEKNAFIYATAGKIEALKFGFTANKIKAIGNMTILYHGLDIAVKNKRTDDTTGMKEKIISLVANIKVLNSNPLPKENVREGTIDVERDPERFIFDYCFKSILSGIKSSLVRTPRKK